MSDLPSKLHFVNVGPQGTFRPAGKVSTSPTDIDAILDHVRTSDVSKIAIHFHGGLVSQVRSGLVPAPRDEYAAGSPLV
jgi:hypothetical protein